MKKSFLKFIELVLTTLSVALIVSAISCKTTHTPDKPMAGPSSVPAVTNQPLPETTTTNSTKRNYYTCAMHPEVHSQDPDGKCPICQMPLVPADEVPVEPMNK